MVTMKLIAPNKEAIPARCKLKIAISQKHQHEIHLKITEDKQFNLYQHPNQQRQKLTKI